MNNPVVRAALQQHFDVNSGNCDLCGLWDGKLIAGVGSCCRKDPQLEIAGIPAAEVVRDQEKAEHKRPDLCRRKLLPGNELAWKDLIQAQAALVDLNDDGCWVQRIDRDVLGITITLARPPPEGVIPGRMELIRMSRTGKREMYFRADYRDVTVEWPAP